MLLLPIFHIGYDKGEWIGPISKIWTLQQCKKVTNQYSVGLKECQNRCNQERGCNAINFNPSKNGCVGLKCDVSQGVDGHIPKPSKKESDHVGYCMKSSTTETGLSSSTTRLIRSNN